MTPEIEHNNEAAAIKRVRQAFRRREAAWMAVRRNSFSYDNGNPADDFEEEFEAARKEFISALDEMDRITRERRNESFNRGG